MAERPPNAPRCWRCHGVIDSERDDQGHLTVNGDCTCTGESGALVPHPHEEVPPHAR